MFSIFIIALQQFHFCFDELLISRLIKSTLAYLSQESDSAFNFVFFHRNPLIIHAVSLFFEEQYSELNSDFDRAIKCTQLPFFSGGGGWGVNNSITLHISLQCIISIISLFTIFFFLLDSFDDLILYFYFLTLENKFGLRNPEDPEMNLGMIFEIFWK